jgi:hypothetical protein
LNLHVNKVLVDQIGKVLGLWIVKEKDRPVHSGRKGLKADQPLAQVGILGRAG